MKTPIIALVLAVAGCGTGGTGTNLAATLVSPTDAALEWTGGEPGMAGRTVEFATEPAGRYTVLQFVPPERTTFRHPDLMPETPFYYRVRPYFGPVSAPVEVVLPAGAVSEQDQANDHEWAPPRTIPGGPVASESVRAAGAAGPAGLTANVMHANGIRFTWTDNARDEEGYLLEVRHAGHAGYTVAAVLDPDVNSFGLITLPTEKVASFRVRAFYYGASSNVAKLTTGRQ